MLKPSDRQELSWSGWSWQLQPLPTGSSLHPDPCLEGSDGPTAVVWETPRHWSGRVRVRMGQNCAEEHDNEDGWPRPSPEPMPWPCLIYWHRHSYCVPRFIYLICTYTLLICTHSYCDGSLKWCILIRVPSEESSAGDWSWYLLPAEARKLYNYILWGRIRPMRFHHITLFFLYSFDFGLCTCIFRLYWKDR